MSDSLRERVEKIMQNPNINRVIAVRMATQQLRYESEQKNRKLSPSERRSRKESK